MLGVHFPQPRKGYAGADYQGPFCTGKRVTTTFVALEAIADLISALGKLDLTVRGVDTDHSQFQTRF